MELLTLARRLELGPSCMFHWSRAQDAGTVQGGDCCGCSLEELISIAAEKHRPLTPVLAGDNSERFLRGSLLGRVRDWSERVRGIGTECFLPVMAK